VPGEAKLVHLILSNVKKGAATPEELNRKVKAFYPKKSDNEVISIRAGAVSRICELGLLDREKDGVKVTYVVTERGEKHLERLATLGA
jgi:predicted MarR family transcription regulator